MRAPWAVSSLCAAAVTLSGCPARRGNVASHLANAPELAATTGQAKCGVRASSSKPLIVEWPAADRAALEARANRGLVAVRYEGCDMEVLTNCTATGEYGYLPLTPKREAVRINNADDLYANLPIGAAKLEAKLARDGQLNVDMLIIGRKEAEQSTFSERDLQGRCTEATHVVTGLTVGAFSFYTGASAEIGAGASIGNIGAGASSGHRREVLNQDGSESACAAGPTDPTIPPVGCGALLRVEIVPIDRVFAPTPMAATSTSPTAAASPPGGDRNLTSTSVTADADRGRQLRLWGGITIAGYGLALASVGMLYGGLFLTKKGKEQAVAAEAPGVERQAAIRKYKTGIGLAAGGAVGAALFATLAVVGNARVRRLRSQRASAAVVPGFGRSGASLALDVKF